MQPFTHRIAVAATMARPAAFAALLGAALLAGPLTPARADSAATPMRLAQATPSPAPAGSAATPGAAAPSAAAPSTAAPSPAAPKTAASRQAAVEQRIASLHKSLKITAAEEPDWNAVAQAMRDNAATMEKLVEERTTQAPQNMTALDDLNDYAKFAQAHADGLKNLVAAFQTLYDSMPDAQKKIADRVFANARHQGARAHG